MSFSEFYHSIPLKKIAIDDVKIGVRILGSGFDLIFIHGFPTNGYTWRFLLPELSKHFSCHILDLPGLGESEWGDHSKFDSTSQAKYILEYIRQIQLDTFDIIAHNSGATIARIIGIICTNKLKRLYLMNTEIPNHRPPWIPFYQRIASFFITPYILRSLMKNKYFLQSSVGFRELYSDKSLLRNSQYLAYYINPLIRSNQKAIGALQYLKGIDWVIIDSFKQLHSDIKASVILFWGTQDSTFPLLKAYEMIQQFNNCRLFEIKDSSLLPHEEKPDVIISAVIKYSL
ncbi:MAG: alpha/beta hydrolase [Bacteroidota bacterium]